jgi:hypothetical protein
MTLPSPSTTTGSAPADHDGLASPGDGPPDNDDTGSKPIIDDKEVQEVGQYTLQASLDTGLPVDNEGRDEELIVSQFTKYPTGWTKNMNRWCVRGANENQTHEGQGRAPFFKDLR